MQPQIVEHASLDGQPSSQSVLCPLGQLGQLKGQSVQYVSMELQRVEQSLLQSPALLKSSHRDTVISGL